MTDYPTTLHSFTDVECSDSRLPKTVTNSLQDEVGALQTKVGVDSSAVATSIDYLLKSTSSSNPGHKHTLVDGATDVTASATELNILDGVTSIWEEVYPVGAVYISVVSTTPATLFGGTWSAFGAGKVMVGLDAGDGDFDTSEKTGGAKTHTLTEAEMPAHTHDVFGINRPRGAAADIATLAAASNDSDKTSGSTGSGDAHDNVQPYIVVYLWKRTA